MKIGLKIKKRREELSITQEELASRLDTTRQTIYNWENDCTSPDAFNLDQLSKALRCSVEYFFREDCESQSKITAVSSTNSLEGDTFDKTVGLVKKHWRKIYIHFFVSGGLITLMGALIRVSAKLFTDTANDQLEDFNNSNFGYSPYYPGTQSQQDMTNSSYQMFKIFSNIALCIGGALLIAGVVLLILDIIAQNKNKQTTTM